MSITPQTHRHAGAKQARKPRGTRKATKTARRGATSEKTDTSARRGTKQAILIEMLSQPKGAALADMAAKTGWQKHSVRGAISGTLKKKLGLAVTSAVVVARGRVYRIDYTTSRPHSALAYATPEEFASSLQGHAPGEMTTSARPGQNQQPGLSC